MIEIFIIYDKTTSFIEGSGNIDREWDQANIDGSTALEYITETLAKDLALDVVYLSLQELPDPKVHKISNGEIVNLTAPEMLDVELPESRETLIQKKMREMAIAELKAEDKLTADYQDNI